MDEGEGGGALTFGGGSAKERVSRFYISAEVSISAIDKAQLKRKEYRQFHHSYRIPW